MSLALCLNNPYRTGGFFVVIIPIMSTQAINPPALSEEEKQRQHKEAEKQKDRRAAIRATSELLFVFLPFIVIGITLMHRGEFPSIFFIPEWSIVSAVVTGQAIVKLASAGIGRAHVRKESIVLVISALLVCLLVPVLIILAITLTSPNVSRNLAITQAVCFLLSVLSFWIACLVENYVRDEM